MTPRQKAQELVKKFSPLVSWDVPLNPDLIKKDAKKCAHITVSEILAKHYDDWNEESTWWQEVKQEIEKL